jgi:hypothetical protein
VETHTKTDDTTMAVDIEAAIEEISSREVDMIEGEEEEETIIGLIIILISVNRSKTRQKGVVPYFNN